VRALTWDGLLNVRDLGGHATEDGGVTQFGRIVRADSVRRLSHEGWASVFDYGIRTVVDLRFQREQDEDTAGIPDLELVHVSLFGEPDDTQWTELDAHAAATGSSSEATRFVYLELLEMHRDHVAEAITVVGRAAPGGVVVHCHAGKDRTGLVTALLLRLAGVPRADVADDYALSEANLAPQNEEWIAEAEDEAERTRRRWITSTPAPAMLGVLEELEQRYGDVESYLRAGGALPEDVEAARARLLTP
jgi:protein-tyrosine phosphatase